MKRYITKNSYLIIKEPLIIGLEDRSINIVINNQMDIDFVTP